MLILSRVCGESIIIGDNEVKVTILGVKSNQVRLGIEADESIPVNREEVYERILNERRLEENNGNR